MKAFRICKKKYSKDTTGHGAKLSGGRWNSKGTPVIYSASTVSLALLETLVHVDIKHIPKNLVFVEYYIPDDVKIKSVSLRSLPADWKDYPAPTGIASIGDKFVWAAKELIMKVPTAIAATTGEYNVLINPIHPDLSRIKVVKVKALQPDSRLLG